MGEERIWILFQQTLRTDLTNRIETSDDEGGIQETHKWNRTNEEIKEKVSKFQKRPYE